MVFRDDAKIKCENMDSYLVTIDSAEENSALFQWLKNVQDFEWSEWFLGPYIGIKYDDETSKFE